jgi:hypothetical protein
VWATGGDTAGAKKEGIVITVAFATCAELTDLDEDTRRLIEPLAARGVAATPAIWDDVNVDWTRFNLVVVRSCWDYVPRRSAFLEWACRLPHLANPAAVLAWNTDKRYLRDLADCGVPVMPTTWVNPEQAWAAPESGSWVIKPAVSIASLDAGRYRIDDSDERRLAIDHVRRLQAAGRVVMVQPYFAGVDDEGETALVYVRGMFSHAVRKGPVLTGPDEGIDRRFQPQGGLNLRVHQPSSAQFAAANQVLGAVPGGCDALLYARVDLVPGADGNPVLMELELTEPQLYFSYEFGAADRMAAAISARVLCENPAQGGKHNDTSKDRELVGEGLRRSHSVLHAEAGLRGHGGRGVRRTPMDHALVAGQPMCDRARVGEHS